MSDWSGKKVLILGAGRQGIALARYLTRHGANVVLNDKRMDSELREAKEALKETPVVWETGWHPISLLEGTDTVCVSGGIPLSLPIVREARRRGIPLSNDTQIFMEAVPCQTIGITGSAGKTTTTTLVGLIANEALKGSDRRAWVGGNIGDPLLNYVDEMSEKDIAILEISSFQLEQMTRSPNIAAVLNITPNHLDRHKTMEAYTAAKARILDFQTPEDTAILCREDEGAWALREKVRGSLFSFGFAPPQTDVSGTYLLENTYLYMRDKGMDVPLLTSDAIHLRGAHNQMNVLAACAIAYAAGFPSRAIENAVDGFEGVPHRLEFVREWHGAAWYNDSIATAPERTMAAIRSFDEPLILLLGGRDKNLPWNALAELVHQRVDHVVLFGEAAEKIAAAIGGSRHGARPYSVTHCIGLKDAVEAAAKLAKEGDVVLLSPGGTSFDEFRDFAERGERFRQWVLELS
jgi:UDP-N-acetylmuramoylalanine--D-glutamate ligase